MSGLGLTRGDERVGGRNGFGREMVNVTVGTRFCIRRVKWKLQAAEHSA